MKRGSCCVFATVAFFICQAVKTAGASDECDFMAAKIANAVDLTAGHRTAANFIPMSPRRGEYGAYLNCAGSSGMSLSVVSPPNPGEDWYQFVTRSASILTNVVPTIINNLVRRCAKAASQQEFSDLQYNGIKLLCDADKNDKRVELTIARMR